MNLTRWRNSHGFGVHSPLGYEISQRVVNLPKIYTYYAETSICKDAKREKLSQAETSHAVKLHRLAALLNIRQVISDKKPSQTLLTALTRASAKIKTVKPSGLSNATLHSPLASTGADLFLLRQSYSREVYSRLLSTPGNTVVIYSSNPSDAANQLIDAIESGIVIEGCHCALAIAKPQTQPVRYLMNF